MSDVTYIGLAVDNLDSGLFTAPEEGLRIDPVRGLSIDASELDITTFHSYAFNDAPNSVDFNALALDSIGTSLLIDPVYELRIDSMLSVIQEPANYNILTYQSYPTKFLIQPNSLFTGLLVDANDSGLFVDDSNGVGVDSVYNTSVSSDTLSINTYTAATIKYLNMSPATYESNIDESLFYVNNTQDILDFGGGTYLQTDQYATYDAIIHREKTIIPDAYSITESHIGTYLNQAVYVLPELYNVSGFDVGLVKNNQLYAEIGSYSISSFAIYTEIQNKLQEGRYVKDSANVFNLYIDQGSDYFIIVEAEKIGRTDFDGMTFTGKFAKHSTSVNKYSIECTLLTNTQLKLRVTSQVSADLYGKFSFDVAATKNNITTKILQGNIIINELVTL